MSCGCGCGGSAQAGNARRGLAGYSKGSFGFADAATPRLQPTQALGKLPAPPSGIALAAGPATARHASCPQAHHDATNIARQIARLKAALTRRPPDAQGIVQARKALQMAVTGILQSGHYARTSCGKQDLLRLQRFLARIGAGLPPADRVLLNRISHAARVFAVPG